MLSTMARVRSVMSDSRWRRSMAQSFSGSRRYGCTTPPRDSTITYKFGWEWRVKRAEQWRHPCPHAHAYMHTWMDGRTDLVEREARAGDQKRVPLVQEARDGDLQRPGPAARDDHVLYVCDGHVWVYQTPAIVSRRVMPTHQSANDVKDSRPPSAARSRTSAPPLAPAAPPAPRCWAGSRAGRGRDCSGRAARPRRRGGAAAGAGCQRRWDLRHCSVCACMCKKMDSRGVMGDRSTCRQGPHPPPSDMLRRGFSGPWPGEGFRWSVMFRSGLLVLAALRDERRAAAHSSCSPPPLLARGGRSPVAVGGLTPSAMPAGGIVLLLVHCGFEAPSSGGMAGCLACLSDGVDACDLFWLRSLGPRTKAPCIKFRHRCQEEADTSCMMSICHSPAGRPFLASVVRCWVCMLRLGTWTFQPSKQAAPPW